LKNIKVVLNKSRDDDVKLMSDELEKRGLPLLGFLSFEPKFIDADIKGVSPIDHAPESKVIKQVKQIMKKLTKANLGDDVHTKN
jgi:CO dehydrogenase nickel-insertion accessory protein CooC1